MTVALGMHVKGYGIINIILYFDNGFNFTDIVIQHDNQHKIYSTGAQNHVGLFIWKLTHLHTKTSSLCQKI